MVTVPDWWQIWSLFQTGDRYGHCFRLVTYMVTVPDWWQIWSLFQTGDIYGHCFRLVTDMVNCSRLVIDMVTVSDWWQIWSGVSSGSWCMWRMDHHSWKGSWWDLVWIGTSRSKFIVYIYSWWKPQCWLKAPISTIFIGLFLLQWCLQTWVR